MGVTGRRRADEDHTIPGSEPVDSDTDPAETETTSERVGGHNGPDAGDRENIPSLDQQQDDGTARAGLLDDASIGRWACRFCETERRKPSGLAVHHATCSDSQFYREHQWQNEETDERDPIAVAEDTDEQNDPSTATGGESPGERRTFSYRV